MNTLPKLSSLTLPWPVNWPEVFGVERPLILDIGFGYGHTLEHLHRQHPDHNIVGIEISNQCMVKAEKAIPRKRMQNVRVVHSTAETALHHLFEPASLAQIHINFPDPWFKQRHAGRRLVQRDTLDAMVNRLAPGGMFYLATDILPYAEMSAELLANTPGLDNVLDAPWTNALPGRTVTKYERKAIAEGRERYFFAYRRNLHPAPDVPVMREYPMPHMVIKTRLDFEAVQRDFERIEYAEADTRINVMQAYRGNNALLFETFIHEPTIDQQVAIMLVRRDGYEAEYTLKLSALGTPRPTAGVHRAVALIGDWLVGQYPDAEVLQSKIQRK